MFQCPDYYERPMLDLSQLANDLVEKRWQCDSNMTRRDRFLTDGRMNGLAWIAMNSEEKSACLLGFESGIQTAAEYAGVNAGDTKVEDGINATLLLRNAPGFSVEHGIDR